MLATRGIRYTAMGPHMAGTSAVMLTDSAGNGGGAAGETVYARGGPGALAAALASAAREAGVEIRTGAEVIAIRDDHEAVTGVALADGEEIEAGIVVSGLDPRTTLQGLVDPETLGPELGWEVDNLRDRGATAKVNLALSELPAFSGLDGDDGAMRLRGRIVIAPSIRYLDQAADAAKYGRISEAPWLEATIPSLVDPLLTDGAAAGGVKHVMSVIVQTAPYALRESDWETERERFGDLVVSTLETRGPGHQRAGRGAAGAHTARPGAGLRAVRRASAAPGAGAGPVVRLASAAGLRPPPHARAWPLPVWLGRAPRRRRHRPARSQRGGGSAGRPQSGTVGQGPPRMPRPAGPGFSRPGQPSHG